MTNLELTQKQLLSASLHSFSTFFDREQLLALMGTAEVDDIATVELITDWNHAYLKVSEEQKKALK